MNSIYPENFEAKVGFDQVRQGVAKRCLCPLGERMCLEATFSSSYLAVGAWLNQTAEMKDICLLESNFPVEGYADATPFLQRVEHEGSWLDESEMVTLRKSLEAIRSLIAFFTRGETPKYPHLTQLARGIAYYPYISERIDAIVSKYGKVKDNASPELARIRGEIALKQASISKRMQSILKAAQTEGIVEADVSPSVRDGRIVIPVIAANKRKLKGFIHDESTSGRTVYIEPAELVELNNDIRELEYDERREVVRILVEFANTLRPYLPELLQSYHFLGTIDFIRAKARYAVDHEGAKPILQEQPGIYLRKAVHPILLRALRREGKDVVPLDIELNESNRILLISGPNAGGKSVCLKTVGVNQYMMQCGFLPSVLENSEMGIFTSIFIDIGDEQSLENDLSTYSSHLLNMKHFLRNSSSSTLVLIDEFGAGTEPMVGGAIAEAILEQLRLAGTYGVITTHYSNLKHYASSAVGVVNGAMQFDTGRIEPLFKMEMGKPGSSFAFEIARKIGLPEGVLKHAEGKMGSEHVTFEKHLREISRDKRYWEKKREGIRIASKKANDLEQTLETELQSLKELRKEIIRKAKEEAQSLLAQTNKMIESTIRGIREAEAEKERTKTLRASLETFKEQVDSGVNPTEDRINRKIEQIKGRQRRSMERAAGRGEAIPSPSSTPQVQPLAQGDKVRIVGQDALGEVMEIGQASVVVAFGSMITTIASHRLERVSATEYRKAQRASGSSPTAMGLDMNRKRLNFKPDIDVRGLRAEEAIEAVQALVDEAAMVGFSRVRVLHGKGNGILRQQIRTYLKTVPHVASFADEAIEMGGTGITVVEVG